MLWPHVEKRLLTTFDKWQKKLNLKSKAVHDISWFKLKSRWDTQLLDVVLRGISDRGDMIVIDNVPWSSSTVIPSTTKWISNSLIHVSLMRDEIFQYSLYGVPDEWPHNQMGRFLILEVDVIVHFCTKCNFSFKYCWNDLDIADNVISQLYSLDVLSSYNFISFLRFGVMMDIQDQFNGLRRQR